MPRVSIGIPVYNGENYLRDAIESILNQTYSNFELIISDNGSIDSTPDLCREYADRDTRVRLFLHDKNRGAAWNYNYVFSQSKGEFFKWAPHDDVIASTYIERCVEVFDHHPEAVLCYPKTLIVDHEGGNPTPYQDGLHLVSPDAVERFKECLFRKNRKCNAVLGVIRSSSLAKTGRIGNYNASDQVLLLHLTLLGEFHEVPEQLMYRRDHPGTSLRANPTARGVAAWFDPLKKHKIVLPTLRLGKEYLRCIFDTDLQRTKKFSCAKLVVKKLFWERWQIAYEIKAAWGDLVRKSCD